MNNCRSHVEIAAHGGIEGDLPDEIAVIAERVIPKDTPVRRERIGIIHVEIGHDPDLTESEGDALAKLIGTLHRVLEEGGLNGTQIVVVVALEAQNILIGKVGNRRSVELILQPGAGAGPYDAVDGIGGSAPGRLVEKTRGGGGADLSDGVRRERREKTNKTGNFQHGMLV